MKCPNCKYRVRPNAKKCVYCGRPLKIKKEQVIIKEIN